MPEPNRHRRWRWLALAWLPLLHGCVDGNAQEPGPTPLAADARESAAAVPDNALRDAYFGDLHVHSSLSLDSYPE